MYKFPVPFLLIASAVLLGDLSLTQAQQPSLIEQMNLLKPSVVKIKALNMDIYQGQRPRAAIDRKTGRIIVLRNVKTGSYNRSGAGVFVHESGIIVTNAHVITNADRLTVILNDNTELPAKALMVVKDMDFGFIQVQLPYRIKPVAMANSDEIHLRDEIVTIGNSEFLQQTVSGGQIIGIGNNRTLTQTGKKNTYLIQTSVNLYEGDSGGPLFNRDGKLVGLMTAKEVATDHSSFAIPSNIIHRFLQEYLHGYRP